MDIILISDDDEEEDDAVNRLEQVMEDERYAGILQVGGLFMGGGVRYLKFTYAECENDSLHSLRPALT